MTFVGLFQAPSSSLRTYWNRTTTSRRNLNTQLQSLQEAPAEHEIENQGNDPIELLDSWVLHQMNQNLLEHYEDQQNKDESGEPVPENTVLKEPIIAEQYEPEALTDPRPREAEKEEPEPKRQKMLEKTEDETEVLQGRLGEPVPGKTALKEPITAQQDEHEALTDPRPREAEKEGPEPKRQKMLAETEDETEVLHQGLGEPVPGNSALKEHITAEQDKHEALEDEPLQLRDEAAELQDPRPREAEQEEPERKQQKLPAETEDEKEVLQQELGQPVPGNTPVPGNNAPSEPRTAEQYEHEALEDEPLQLRDEPEEDECSDEDLLILLKKALKNETKRKGLGSFLMDLMKALSEDNIDQTQLNWALASSIIRRLTRDSCTIRYDEIEYTFWNLVKSVHGESVIRMLSGKGNFGAVKRGLVGNQPSEDCLINLAVPSQKQRKKHPTATTFKETKPGIIDSSIEALKQGKIDTVALSIDEMTLAKGVQTVSTENQNGELTFEIFGAADYVCPEVNAELINIKYCIHQYSKEAEAFSDDNKSLEKNINNISQLINQLEIKRTFSIKSLKEMSKHSSQNKSTIASLTSEISAIETSISNCKSNITKMLRLSVIRDFAVEDGDFNEDTIEKETNLKLLSSFSSSVR